MYPVCEKLLDMLLDEDLIWTPRWQAATSSAIVNNAMRVLKQTFRYLCRSIATVISTLDEYVYVARRYAACSTFLVLVPMWNSSPESW